MFYSIIPKPVGIKGKSAKIHATDKDVPPDLATKFSKYAHKAIINAFVIRTRIMPIPIKDAL